MMKKILLFFVLLFTGLVGAQIFVSPSGTDTNTGKTWQAAVKTVDKALELSSSGGTIYLSAGTFVKTGISENAAAGSSMPDGKNITIIGGFPSTLTGTATTGYNPNLNKTYIVHQGGSDTSMFVLNQADGNLAIRGVIFDDRDTTGGVQNTAIFTAHGVSGKNYSFQDVLITNSLGVTGIGLFYLRGNSTGNTMNFENIVAYNNQGSVISVDVFSGNNTINIRNSNFKDNRDTSRGGVLLFDSKAGAPNLANIEGNNFCNNDISGVGIGGGVIATDGSAVRLINNRFSGNNGNRGNVAYFDETQVYSSGNIYSFNTSGANSDGGAIFILNPVSFDKLGQAYDYMFLNDKFHYNSAGQGGGHGGAIYINGINLGQQANNALYIQNVEFLGNKANWGGAIYANNSSVLVSNSKFRDNLASDNALTGRGGAIYLESGAQLQSISNCYTNNKSAGAGGAIFYDGGSTVRFPLPGTVTYTAYTSGDMYYGNTSGGRGGGAVFYNIVRNGIAIINSQYYNNSTAGISGEGGAIKVEGDLQGNDNVTLFTGNKFGGNLKAGSATLPNGSGGSDIKTYFTEIQNITNSVMQLSAQNQYPSSDFSFGAGNTFGGAAIPVDGCNIVAQTDICPLTKTAVDITGEIIAVSDSYIFPLGIVSTITNILGNDSYYGSPATTSNVTITFGTPSNPNITVNPSTGQITVGSGTPAGTHTVMYTICDKANATICSTTTVYITIDPTLPTVCYNPVTNTNAGSNTRHGITALSRAGADNGNWPMLRKSAYTVLESKTKGFVITRNASPETTISNPVIGMMVFDTDENAGAGCLKINTDGTSAGWKCFTQPACPTN